MNKNEVYKFGAKDIRLWGSERGRKVRAEIEAMLDGVPAGEALRVSLDGVEVMDVSFSLEVFGKLYGSMASIYPERALVLEKPSAYVKTNIDAALQMRGLMALTVKGARKWDLIGKVSETDRETLQALQDRREATAPELAQDLGIKLTACNQRLRKLAEGGIILRSRMAASSGGEQYLYRWPVTVLTAPVSSDEVKQMDEPALR